MANANITVEQISNKSVTTKFGPKQTFSFKGSDGEWYNLGFTKPKFVKGDQVSFEYEETTYGKAVAPSTVSVSGGGGSGDAPTPAAKPTYAARNSTFPVPPLDGSRAIIRQNALTNARESVCAALNTGKGFGLDVDDFSNMVITLARKFEQYTAGDIDSAAAAAMVKKSKGEVNE